MNLSKELIVALAVAVTTASCASKPVTAPRVVIPETVHSEVRVAGDVAGDFGDVTPMAIGLSNGASTNYAIRSDRVLALDQEGRWIAPLSNDEAIRQSGGGTALLAGLKGAGGGALLTGVLGAATGAIVGAASGGAGKGAAVGAGIGVATGALAGFFESKNKTDAEIADQIRSISLGAETLKPGLPVSGFVFFPKGDYYAVKVILVNQSTEGVEEVQARIEPEEE